MDHDGGLDTCSTITYNSSPELYERSRIYQREMSNIKFARIIGCNSKNVCKIERFFVNEFDGKFHSYQALN